MNQTAVSPLGGTNKSILSLFSSFSKEENRDTIDYHLTQNMFGHEHKLYNIIDRTLCG
jgi:hypothetical protein